MLYCLFFKARSTGQSKRHRKKIIIVDIGTYNACRNNAKPNISSMRYCFFMARSTCDVQLVGGRKEKETLKRKMHRSTGRQEISVSPFTVGEQKNNRITSNEGPLLRVRWSCFPIFADRMQYPQKRIIYYFFFRDKFSPWAELVVCLIVCGISLTSEKLLNELFTDCKRSCHYVHKLELRIFTVSNLYFIVTVNTLTLILPVANLTNRSGRG